MIKNCVFNTIPYMAHAPGLIEFIPLWDKCNLLLSQVKKYKKPNNLTIITFNNKKNGHNLKKLGLFELFLKKSEIYDYVCLGQNVENWKNKIKIELLIEEIKNIKTEYVLIADSSDVFILRSFNSIIEDFEKINCDALFNFEKNQWPREIPELVSDFETQMHPGKYLNAGLWISKTCFLKKILREVEKIQKFYKSNSEQFYYKLAYLKFYPKMKIDERCCLFQGLNRTKEDELKFIKTFY